MTIRKAIIPVAGFGTRFLPATKAQPKGMLTLVDKPIVQHVVEEAVAAGIEQIIFITDHSKRAIEDHFDSNFELEWRLKDKNKLAELEAVTKISGLAHFAYVRQANPNGDGHAILLAKRLIGNEPCAVLFSDEVIRSSTPTVTQLQQVYERHQAPVIMARRVPREDISRYGCIAGDKLEDGNWRVTGLIEKPKPEEAPSDLAIAGRYVITPEVFDALERATPSPDGEVRLIDAFRTVLGERELYAHELEGQYYDCGNKLQFMTAAVDFAIEHDEANRDGVFTDWLKRRAQEL